MHFRVQLDRFIVKKVAKLHSAASVDVPTLDHIDPALQCSGAAAIPGPLHGQL
jgi:hypothetical protein